MAVLVYLVLLLVLAVHSNGATYCLCKDGLSDAVLQKSLDYACGAGADCTPILQNGACFQPNNVKDHCNYAVNSYYQKKGQVAGSCDFTGTAATSANPPTSVASGCVYPTSNTGTGTTTTPTTGTGGTGTGTGTGTNTGTGTGTGTTGVNPTFGLGPTGSGSIDNAGVAPIEGTSMLLASLSLWFSVLFLLCWG